MREVFRAMVTTDPDDCEDYKATIEADGTYLDIVVALLAVVRETWRDIADGDQKTGDMIREWLTRAVNNPDFWTLEEAASHD